MKILSMDFIVHDMIVWLQYAIKYAKCNKYDDEIK